MEEGPNIQVLVRDDETCCDRTYFFCCHPTGKAHRFIALIFMCFLGFGSYFCYDNPAALEEHTKEDLSLTDQQFLTLYSVYSWPNVIMCFIGGFLIDRVFGVRAGTNIFMGLTLLGQIIFAFAAYVNRFWIMLVGRFVFGIGAESLAVAQNNYAVLWFKGRELNMVFGLQLSFARVGSTVNFWIMEPIYNWVQENSHGSHVLGIALFIAGLTCIFSMLCALILGLLDKRAERITRRVEAQTTEIVKITDVKDFKISFWLVTLICVSYYVAIFPFISVGQDFFMKRFDMDKQDADEISSLIYLISGIASPICGFIIDRAGLNVLWILISEIVTIIAHLLLGFSNIDPYIGIVMLGIAYSFLASGLWPMVALIVPEYQLGTAYGVCQAIQNLGLAITALIAGWIVERWGYRTLSTFFVSSLLVAFLLTGALLLLDQYEKGILNMTPGGRRRYQESLLNAIIDRQRALAAEELPTSEEELEEGNPEDVRNKNRFLNRVGAELPQS